MSLCSLSALLGQSRELASVANSYLLEQRLGAMVAASSETAAPAALEESLLRTWEGKTSIPLSEEKQAFHPLELPFHLNKHNFVNPKRLLYRDYISSKYSLNNIFSLHIQNNPFSLKVQERISKNTQSDWAVFWEELFINYNQGKPQSNSWFLLIVFGILALLSALLTNYGKDVKKIFQSFSNSSLASQCYRESTIMSPVLLGSKLLYSMSLGSIVFLAMQEWGSSTVGIGTWFLCTSAVAVMQFARFLQLEFLALILPVKKDLHFYNFIVSNTNHVNGFLLIPFVLFLAYSPEQIESISWFSLVVFVGVSYLYRCFRALNLAMDQILFHKFHFLLYLCSVEIAPVLLICKAAQII